MLSKLHQSLNSKFTEIFNVKCWNVRCWHIKHLKSLKNIDGSKDNYSRGIKRYVWTFE